MLFVVGIFILFSLLMITLFPAPGNEGMIKLITTDKKEVAEYKSTSTGSLYQGRLIEEGWRSRQCDLAKERINADQTVFPYVEFPPRKGGEWNEQFVEPVKKLEQANTRIAVLHVWSSSERMAPPFFQYWAASAVANDAIADFFIFVPDEETALVLRDLLPPLSSNHNI